MIDAYACAKVNLSLRVAAPRPDGLHPLRGLFQSIAWADRLTLADAEADAMQSPQGDVVDGWDNLAWRAIDAVRRDAGGSATTVAVTLSKQIPIEAGLGGGSADAAAGLVVAGRRFGVALDQLAGLASMLGSDVPFCLVGGLAEVTGTGDAVRPLPEVGGYSLGMVVPPANVSTMLVYQAWDRLEGPIGYDVGEQALPPGLREAAPLRNDLFLAAIDVAPIIDEWRAELAARWARPVLMTGSGPTLFAFFGDDEEAGAALGEVPPGARATAVAGPVPFGWAARQDSGPLFGPRGQLDEAEEGRLADVITHAPTSAAEPSTIEDPSG